MALTGLLLVAACSKEDSTPKPGSSWRIDGQAYSSAQVLASDQGGQLQVDIWQNISTPTSNGSAVICTLQLPRQIGTFNVAGTSARASASYVDYSSSTNGQSNELYPATQGSVTISSLSNGYVTGSFNFSGTGLRNPQLSKTLSDGKFTAKLP